MKSPWTRRFDNELLQSSIKRDNALLLGEYLNLNGSSKILFTCTCGNELSKIFRNIVLNGGAFCKICTNIRAKEKYKIASLNKYEVEHPSSAKEIKKKLKIQYSKNIGLIMLQR
jgi:hypothetical protein